MEFSWDSCFHFNFKKNIAQLLLQITFRLTVRHPRKHGYKQYAFLSALKEPTLRAKSARSATIESSGVLYQNVESGSFPLCHVQYQQLNSHLFESITCSVKAEHTLKVLACGHLIEAKVDMNKE